MALHRHLRGHGATRNTQCWKARNKSPKASPAHDGDWTRSRRVTSAHATYRPARPAEGLRPCEPWDPLAWKSWKSTAPLRAHWPGSPHTSLDASRCMVSFRGAPVRHGNGNSGRAAGIYTGSTLFLNIYERHAAEHWIWWSCRHVCWWLYCLRIWRYSGASRSQPQQRLGERLVVVRCKQDGHQYWKDWGDDDHHSAKVAKTGKEGTWRVH